MLTRRTLLCSAAASLGLSTLSFASAPTPRRTLIVLLRGGLDGMAAVPPIGDPDYVHTRGSAALDRGEVVPLDGFFGLHPGLAPLAPLWREGELGFAHAVGLSGGGRSHFDAQDVLDNGTSTAQGERTGWLNRATALLHTPPMALGRQVPLLLRGPERIQAADPLRTVELDSRFLDRVQSMYASDPQLASALSTGLDTQQMLARHRAGRPGRQSLSPASARLIGSLLAAEDGPRIGVLEIGGWDTHIRQRPTLDKRLGDLATGLLSIKEGLGSTWEHTAILAVSEFGRAARGNGTGGTDHGTAGVALLAGGAVAGGAVHADWPGLSTADLFEERDLRSTRDIRAVFKGLLIGHLGLDPREVDRLVFPDSGPDQPLTDLFA